MTIIYPFYPGDEELALKNAKWMNELGPGLGNAEPGQALLGVAGLGEARQGVPLKACSGHSVVVCYDPRCNPGVVEQIGAEFLKAFDKVWRLPAKEEFDGWPQGANYFFRIATTWLTTHPEWPYFMWMEPDAVFLVPGVLDALEAEYARAKKPFMGDRVQVNNPDTGQSIPLHMSGVGIYPNPLYDYAGEAYRAFEIAFDMAGKDQIVPKAHFTNLIEHAWKHPQFHSLDELKTQIAPETILFHSSKDGSLIDLLRQKAAPETDAHSVATEPTSGVKPWREEIGTRPAQPIYDIFIRTYPGDYEWLKYCIQSIKKFCTGFRRIVVVSPQPLPVKIEGVDWRVMNDESPDGYLAQQITKLYADVVTDYQPDYILHVDSDVIFTRPVTPDIFFENGQMLWYYTPWEAIETPWKPVVEKFIRQPVAYEFMRSMPFMVPRWLYPKLREYCYSAHGCTIATYVQNQPSRAFSEFNIMGAYAYRNHTKAFKWVNTLEQMPQHVARQFRSWDGVTPENKAEIENILGGTEEIVHTPMAVTANSVSPQIKKLPNDIWVLEGDQDQISGWVEQENRLDHDQNLLPSILPHIREGDTVVDVGAFIGDHTLAYAKAVGPKGKVYAFEPNPKAFQCLQYNMRSFTNVTVSNTGLSDVLESVPLSGNNGNWGGVYVGEHMKITDVQMGPLETTIPWRVDFIKIDVEGYELKVLRGAGNLINRCHPTMVIEINEIALKRQGNTPEDIFNWLKDHNYGWRIIQENCTLYSPMFDIVCLPPETTQDEVPPSTAPVEAPLTPELSIQDHVKILREYSERGKEQRKYVMGFLKKHRLIPLRPLRK